MWWVRVGSGRRTRIFFVSLRQKPPTIWCPDAPATSLFSFVVAGGVGRAPEGERDKEYVLARHVGGDMMSHYEAAVEPPGRQ